MMDQNMSRRGFIDAAAGIALAGAAGSLIAGRAAQPKAAMAQTVVDATRVSDRYTNEELDAIVMDEPEVTGDYVAPDGTVVPAIYLRLRNRINRIGYGVGSQIEGNGTEWDFYKFLFSEEDAEHYLELPMYKDFNASDYAALSGRSYDECVAILDDMGHRGLLCTRARGGVPYYHLLTSEWGIWEYNLDRYEEPGFLDAWINRAGTDMAIEINDTVRPQLNVMPVSKGVIEGPMAPYTDWEEIFRRNEWIGVAPCQCRTAQNILGPNHPSWALADGCYENHPVETCMIFGDVAKYYIERGEARRLTPEEGIALEKDLMDHGMVPEAQWTKQVDFMCNCSGDCCLILSEYVHAEGVGNVMPQVSRYNLKYDAEACLKCGLCIDRCPMGAIQFGEDGYCVMDAKCVRCGQCALVCPIEARHLVAKPADEWMELPDDMMSDYLDEARRRAAAGMLYDFTQDGLTEPALSKYTSADGWRLDDPEGAGRMVPAVREVLVATLTGSDATDADLLAIAKDGDLSEIIHHPDLPAYNKTDAARWTTPTDAALGL